MRDLQNRCEKVSISMSYEPTLIGYHMIQVVELEIQLDEIKEQYNNVIRNSNSKAQQKKMAFLERNLEQLTLVQKQVCSKCSSTSILISFHDSWSTRTPCSRKRLESQNASSWPGMSVFKIWRLSFKMQIAACRLRTRNLRHNFKRSKSDWIRLEVEFTIS